ncbi:MAG TPA: disulfide bond formation protein B [Gammaproteobacteria bacterium]|nr:disulfide bond formation protein B [Gammaproteobacteria bacterium]
MTTLLSLLDHPRLPFGALFLITAGLLGFGLYLEHWEGLDPCPLCIFQRLAYLAVGVVALLAGLHGARGVFRRVYAALLLLGSLAGAGLAGRQVWLQHLPPDRVPECGLGLEFMLETNPLWEVIATVLKGTGECAVVDWTFLGLSIAEWSLGCFLLFALVSVLLLTRRLPAR